MAQGTRVRGLVADGAVRLVLVEGRELCQHTNAQHQLDAGMGRLASECVLASLLLGAWLKGEEQLTLQFQGTVPRSAVYVDLTENALRARATPSVVGAISGLKGLMHTVKSVGPKKLYEGITEVAGAGLEEGLSTHLRDSAQMSVLLRMGLEETEGELTMAGGFVLERLPAAKGHATLSEEAFVERYGYLMHENLGDLLVGLAFGKLDGEEVQWLETETIEWRCRCSDERILNMLTMIDVTTLVEMANEDHGAEVNCHFCNHNYQVTEAQLRQLIKDKGQA